jgi:hypothetical protein
VALQTVGFVTVLVGVACQEGLRVGLYQLYQRTEAIIKATDHPTHHLPLNDVTSALGTSITLCVATNLWP